MGKDLRESPEYAAVTTRRSSSCTSPHSQAASRHRHRRDGRRQPHRGRRVGLRRARGAAPHRPVRGAGRRAARADLGRRVGERPARAGRVGARLPVRPGQGRGVPSCTCWAAASWGRPGRRPRCPARPSSWPGPGRHPDPARRRRARRGDLGRAGLGTAGAGDSGRPSWYPEVESGTPEDAWRSLWVYTLATGELAEGTAGRAERVGGGLVRSGHVLAITSGNPGEDDWYPRCSTSSTSPPARWPNCSSSDVQLGLGRDARRHAGRRGRGRVQRPADHRQQPDPAGPGRQHPVHGRHRRDRRHRGPWIDGTGWATPASAIWTAWPVHGRRLRAPARGSRGQGTGRVAQSWASGFYPGGAFTAGAHRGCGGQGRFDQPQQVAIIGPGTDAVLASLAHPGTDYLRVRSGLRPRTSAGTHQTARQSREFSVRLPGAGPSPWC